MKMTNLVLSGKLLSVAMLLGCAFSLAPSAQAAPKKVLVVTVTKGFRHPSIPTAEKMTVASLKKYDGVIFANTTGDLPLPDKQGFLDWIKSGKAFMGMHSATDTFRGHQPLDPYTEMIGAEFKGHNAQSEVDCINQDPKHPACRHLGPTWHVKDEMYLMNGFERSKVHGLLGLDKHPADNSPEGNAHTPGDFPVAWCKEYGKGRVFYTSLGHREDVWDPNTPESFKRENPKEVSEAYQKHILGGIKWALGLEKGDAKPQTAGKN